MTSSLKSLRLGIIGIGNMGRVHCESVLAGKVPNCELAAICDVLPEACAAFPAVASFKDSSDLIHSGTVDAVLIATPHYSHTSIGIEALRAGLHVLTEKPISVHKADCERLLAAHKAKEQIFAAMFNQRTDPYYRKVRELVRDGTLGRVRRIHWSITDWFRTEAYYASGGWRATWAGEGGGVLINQCIHNIDLFQWLFGMPKKIRALCQFGRYHDIEVEDDVSAIFEYADGTTATFVTSTGEAPGANRLEVAGENGRLVLESDCLLFERNEIPMSEFNRTCPEGYLRPDTWKAKIPLGSSRGEQHIGILKNFANAIFHGEPLIAPAADGIHSVELINAMLLSSVEDRTVELPLSSKAFDRMLKKLTTESKARKPRVPRRPEARWSRSHDFGAASRNQ